MILPEEKELRQARIGEQVSMFVVLVGTVALVILLAKLFGADGG